MKRIVTGILIIVIVILVVGITSVIYWLKHTEVEMTKQYSTIVVNKNELVDYKVFLNPNVNFTALNQINPVTRRKIADYMRGNNYKLVEGKHMFIITIDDYDEYISNDFKFKRIED